VYGHGRNYTIFLAISNDRRNSVCVVWGGDMHSILSPFSLCNTHGPCKILVDKGIGNWYSNQQTFL
jgi:hypothetical protein